MIFSSPIENEVQCIPQWTGFNTLISFVPSNPSSIIYASFIPAPPTEMSAINTFFVTVKSMLTHLGQHHPVITLDEKIYAPAKEIQWTNYYELKDMIIQLEGLHRAINFMGIICKRMKESSLETLTAKVMKRKHYYRGDRGHTITTEALKNCEILFLELLTEKEHDLFSQVIEKINNIKIRYSISFST